MVFFIYRYLMQFMAFVLGILGFLNAKLKKRNHGLSTQVMPEFKRCIWIHCSSLGEFEQGKVLIDALRTQYPQEKLVLTFFSASGYEKKKNYPIVDEVLYLPYDTSRSMRQLIDLIHPRMVIFVKYEFWFTLLDLLHQRRIPFVFVSSVFRRDQYLFGSFFKPLLYRILNASHVFVQNISSKEILGDKGYKLVTVAGDTRIDRVMELKEQNFSWPAFILWKGSRKCIVAGSTWPEGERIIAEVLPNFTDWKWVLAPHEIDATHIGKLRHLLGDRAVFLSDLGNLEAEIPADKQVLVVDRIGLLSLLYRYGDAAYIGGGLGAGIHNTLEPAVYGLPLIFGPHFTKFQEARDFYERGVARVIISAEEMEVALRYYDDKNGRLSINKILNEYFSEHAGATQKIMTTIEQLIPKP